MCCMQVLKEPRRQNDWRGEGIMRWYPWERYVDHVKGLKNIEADTIFIHGDLDEIPRGGEWNLPNVNALVCLL